MTKPIYKSHAMPGKYYVAAYIGDRVGPQSKINPAKTHVEPNNFIATALYKGPIKENCS
jgi:hypothetical protein